MFAEKANIWKPTRKLKYINSVRRYLTIPTPAHLKMDHKKQFRNPTDTKIKEDCVTRLINHYDERIIQLVAIAQAVISLGLFISGIVLLIEEYRHIPETADKYRAWSIAMTILFGILTLKNDHDDVKRKFNPKLYSSKTISIHLSLISLVPTVIFLVGWLHVASNSVTDEATRGLRNWSICILVYSFLMLTMLWTGAGMFLWHSYTTRVIPKIDQSLLI